jgi:hypothetical protein
MSADRPFPIAKALGDLFIGVGIVLGCFLLGRAFIESRLAERTVSVKGLAEREVDADLAIWPITFKEAGNSLTELQHSIDEKRAVIAAFLGASGFPAAEISYGAPKITDLMADNFGQNAATARFRYVAQATVTLRSSNVAGVKKNIERTGELIAKGIAVAENWENRTQFLFTSLNTIKPAMIEAATRSAREAAEQFAKDSGSKVGKIKSASQGLFEITDRDANSPDRKQVRVVTKVEYYLIDN